MQNRCKYLGEMKMTNEKLREIIRTEIQNVVKEEGDLGYYKLQAQA